MAFSKREDPWISVISKWLKHKGVNEIKTLDILKDCLQFEVNNIASYRTECIRIHNILKGLGWKIQRNKGDWSFVKVSVTNAV